MLRPSPRILPGIYAGFATLALTAIVTEVFVGARATAQGTVVAAGLGSGAFGFFTVARGLAGPVGGALQFARPWLWFTAWAAVGLYEGRYQPLVASALLALGMAVCFLIGGGIAAYRQRA